MKNYKHLPLKLLVLFSLISAYGCSDKDLPTPGDQKDFNASVLRENQMMQYFAGNHLGQTILKYAQADLDNDGREDLIVIFNVDIGKNMMSVIRFQGVDLVETNAVPAPVSDQMIQFKDIDKKPPLEFIIQGRKGAKVGYAIFRVEDGKLADLFGEGMEDCC